MFTYIYKSIIVLQQISNRRRISYLLLCNRDVTNVYFEKQSACQDSLVTVCQFVFSERERETGFWSLLLNMQYTQILSVIYKGTMRFIRGAYLSESKNCFLKGLGRKGVSADRYCSQRCLYIQTYLRVSHFSFLNRFIQVLNKM